MSAFGVSILPTAIARELGEAAMVSIYDFHAEPKDDKQNEFEQEFDPIRVLKAFVIIAYSLMLIYCEIEVLTERSITSILLFMIGLFGCTIGVTTFLEATTFKNKTT